MTLLRIARLVILSALWGPWYMGRELSAGDDDTGAALILVRLERLSADEMAAHEAKWGD